MINGINEDNLSEALVDKADIDLGNVSEINGEFANELNATIVHKTGNETISGEKTFKTTPVVNTTMSGFGDGLSIVDDQGRNKVQFLNYYTSDCSYARMISFNHNADKHAHIDCVVNDSGIYNVLIGGTATLNLPTNDNSTRLATTNWVNTRCNNMLPNYAGVISGIASPYTAPSNGFISFNKSGTGNATVNGYTVYLGGNDAYNEGNVTLYLTKGDVIEFAADTGTNCFVPLKA